VAKTVAAKPEIVQISTAYGGQKEGSPVLPRNKYTSIRDDNPKSKDDAKRPEFKACKFTTEAIITEGTDVGNIHKVCANPACPVHHPKQQTGRGASDAQFKAEQEKRRREEAIATVTGLRVLAAIGAAVPVRLMKRDLFFIVERLTSLLEEPRLQMLARQHGIREKRDDGGIAKSFAAYLRRVDESTLGRALVESAILLAASRGNASQVLREAATAYKVDTDAIAAKSNRNSPRRRRQRRPRNPKAKARRAPPEKRRRPTGAARGRPLFLSAKIAQGEPALVSPSGSCAGQKGTDLLEAGNLRINFRNQLRCVHGGQCTPILVLDSERRIMTIPGGLAE
jgi:ParB family chromosome partitioning protein